jgi:hypothetical protein
MAAIAAGAAMTQMVPAAIPPPVAAATMAASPEEIPGGAESGDAECADRGDFRDYGRRRITRPEVRRGAERDCSAGPGVHGPRFPSAGSLRALTPRGCRQDDPRIGA